MTQEPELRFLKSQKIMISFRIINRGIYIYIHKYVILLYIYINRPIKDKSH